MIDSQVKKVQETFLRVGEEFLLQYLITAHKEFRQKQIHSRIFSMGHCLELFAKGVLVSENCDYPFNHDLPSILEKLNSEFRLNNIEIEVGGKLFSKRVPNFDMGLFENHRDALELYQAIYYLKNIKYFIDKTNDPLFPVFTSLKPINQRFLQLAGGLRNRIPARTKEYDDELLSVVNKLGFESNPIEILLYPGCYF